MFNFQTYFTLNTSYGLVGYNLAREFAKITDFALFPHGGIDQRNNPTDYGDIINKYHTNIRRPSFFPNAPSLNINHQFLLATHVGRGKKVAFTIFELDRLRPIEQDHCLAQDVVITSSSYHKRILEQYGCNAKYIPLGVDRNIFNENIVPASHEALDNNPTVFIMCGKAEIRKGIDVLKKVFETAFSPDDNVLLLMMTHNPYLIKRNWLNEVIKDGNKEWQDYYRTSKNSHKILFIDRVESQQQLAAIFAASDCLISPARAEGFNLELLEMLSVGKWAIASDCTAHSDFPNSAFSINNGIIDYNSAILQSESQLLKISMEPKATEKAFDEPFFNGQGNWFSFGENQISQLINHMRFIHSMKQSGRLGRNNSGIELAKKWSWKNSANQIIEVINE